MENNKILNHLKSIEQGLRLFGVPSVIDYTKSNKHVPYVKIYYRGQQYRIVYFYRRNEYKVFENGNKLISIKGFDNIISFCRFQFTPSLPPEINLYRKITKQEFQDKYGKKT